MEEVPKQRVMGVKQQRYRDELVHFYFSIIYGIILPIDELIFFRGVETTNEIIIATINHSSPLIINDY